MPIPGTIATTIWRFAYAQQHGLRMLCGSDAHQTMDVGRGGILVPDWVNSAKTWPPICAIRRARNSGSMARRRRKSRINGLHQLGQELAAARGYALRAKHHGQLAGGVDAQRCARHAVPAKAAGAFAVLPVFALIHQRAHQIAKAVPMGRVPESGKAGFSVNWFCRMRWMEAGRKDARAVLAQHFAKDHKVVQRRKQARSAHFHARVIQPVAERFCARRKGTIGHIVV